MPDDQTPANAGPIPGPAGARLPQGTALEAGPGRRHRPGHLDHSHLPAGGAKRRLCPRHQPVSRPGAGPQRPRALRHPLLDSVQQPGHALNHAPGPFWRAPHPAPGGPDPRLAAAQRPPGRLPGLAAAAAGRHGHRPAAGHLPHQPRGQPAVSHRRPGCAGHSPERSLVHGAAPGLARCAALDAAGAAHLAQPGLGRPGHPGRDPRLPGRVRAALPPVWRLCGRGAAGPGHGCGYCLGQDPAGQRPTPALAAHQRRRGPASGPGNPAGMGRRWWLAGGRRHPLRLAAKPRRRAGHRHGRAAGHGGRRWRPAGAVQRWPAAQPGRERLAGRR